VDTNPIRIVPIRIVTDSACDLPDAVVDQHRIEIVPLTIRFGAEELVDRVELSPTEFWRRVATSPALPETSAPSPGAFEDTFRKVFAAGAGGIVCVTLSSRLSGTTQSASIAAAAVVDLGRVVVVDSLNASAGQGLLALAAARAAHRGMGLDEIVALTEAARSRTALYGALDTLEHLKRGGRIGGARALMGTMLSIKPIVTTVDGAVAEGGRVRTRLWAFVFLAETVARAGPLESLAVIQADASDVDALVDLVAEHHPRAEILVCDVGPVIGTHTGPRTIGVAFQRRADTPV
jgi:DegV family protein with EDD domain